MMHGDKIRVGRKRIGRFGPDFAWVSTRDLLILVDRNCGRTITNAAEQIICWLAGRWMQDSERQGRNRVLGRRVLYLDTMGRWDELQHDGYAFVGFAPGSPADARLCQATLEKAGVSAPRRSAAC